MTNVDSYGTPIKQITEHSDAAKKNIKDRTAIDKNQCFLAVKKIFQNTDRDYTLEYVPEKDNSEILSIERQIDIEERIKLEKEKVLAVQSILCEEIDIKNEIPEETIETQEDPIAIKDLPEIDIRLKDNNQENNSPFCGFYIETNSENVNNQVIKEEQIDYTIDNNLDKVLEDEKITEFPLDNLLLTPRGM